MNHIQKLFICLFSLLPFSQQIVWAMEPPGAVEQRAKEVGFIEYATDPADARVKVLLTKKVWSWDKGGVKNSKEIYGATAEIGIDADSDADSRFVNRYPSDTYPRFSGQIDANLKISWFGSGFSYFSYFVEVAYEPASKNQRWVDLQGLKDAAKSIRLQGITLTTEDDQDITISPFVAKAINQGEAYVASLLKPQINMQGKKSEEQAEKAQKENLDQAAKRLEKSADYGRILSSSVAAVLPIFERNNKKYVALSKKLYAKKMVVRRKEDQYVWEAPFWTPMGRFENWKAIEGRLVDGLKKLGFTPTQNLDKKVRVTRGEAKIAKYGLYFAESNLQPDIEPNDDLQFVLLDELIVAIGKNIKEAVAKNKRPKFQKVVSSDKKELTLDKTRFWTELSFPHEESDPDKGDDVKKYVAGETDAEKILRTIGGFTGVPLPPELPPEKTLVKLVTFPLTTVSILNYALGPDNRIKIGLQRQVYQWTAGGVPNQRRVYGPILVQTFDSKMNEKAVKALEAMENIESILDAGLYAQQKQQYVYYWIGLENKNYVPAGPQQVWFDLEELMDTVIVKNPVFKPVLSNTVTSYDAKDGTRYDLSPFLINWLDKNRSNIEALIKTNREIEQEIPSRFTDLTTALDELRVVVPAK